MSANVIIGGGIAGLAASFKAREIGVSTTIYEASSRPGGLLDSLQYDGFRFDRAVHLSFAEEAEVRQVFDQTDYLTHRPRSLCWDRDVWLKHPVQNNMYPLPADEKVELIAGLSAAPNAASIENYETWLRAQYGDAIAERWPLVYNEKYWTIPVDQLGTKWVGPRMRKSDMKEVLRGAFRDDETNTYYVKEMRYPRTGGYRAFLEPMLAQADVRPDHRLTGLDLKRRRAVFANGEAVDYRSIISTIPLPVLVPLIADVPREIRDVAETLFATSIDLISVAFSKPKVSPALWFYIYDRDILAARAYSPDWKSPENVPPGCSALQFEIYSSSRKPQSESVEGLKANTLHAIRKMGLAEEGDVLFMRHDHIPYGNVVFDLGMEERRDTVRDWLTQQGVHLAGRFGEWDYLWSNQSMMSGLRAAERAFLATSPAS